MTLKAKKCSQHGCENDANGSWAGSPVCEECGDALAEWAAEQDGPDPHGDRDPTPEEQAGWAMQDKIDMYRNEH